MYYSKKKTKLLYLSICIVLTALIVLSFAISVTGGREVADAITITGNGTADTVSEILNLDRTGADGEIVFDGDSLTELYELLTGSSGATIEDVKALMARPAYDKSSTYAKDDVKSIHYGLNAQDIRDANSGNNIEVTMNGQVWEVVALTTTGKDSDYSAGNVVLTLMLKTSLYNSPFMTYTGNYAQWDGKYFASEYSSSLLRARLLNGKGYDGKEVKYANGFNNLVSLGNKTVTDYPFGIYTDINDAKNITGFLVQPRDVLYQQNESYYAIASTYAGPSHGNWNALSNPNDSSLNKITPDSKWLTERNFTNAQERIVGNTIPGTSITLTAADQCYFDWGYDFLWIPSITEAGLDEPKVNYGLWALDNSQRNPSSAVWYRSGFYADTNFAYLLQTDGQYIIANTAENGVRPAINLDLSAADDAAAKRLNEPADVDGIEYTGKKLKLEDAYSAGLADWYDNDFASKVSVTYYNSANVEIDPIEPGTYLARLTINDADEDSWIGGSTAPKDINVTIIPKYIDFPTWLASNEDVYSGGDDILFTLNYYEDLSNELIAMGKSYFEIVNLTHAGTLLNGGNTSSGGVSLDDYTWEISASVVGEYTLDVSLADTTHYQWKKGAPSKKQLEFKINKKKIYLELTGTDGTTTQLKGMEKGKLSVRIEVDADPNKQPDEGKELSLTIKAAATGAVPIPIATDIELTSDMLKNSREIIAELDLSKLRAGRTYTLVVEAVSDEYEIADIPTVTLEVEAKASNVVTWNLYANNKKQIGYYYDVQLAETDVTFDKELIYDGKAYKFEAKLPTGYSLKTSEFLNGYQVVPGKGATNTKAGTNADTYITKVAIYKQTDPNNTLYYTISWEIKQVVFDLDAVKWLYDDGSSLQLPYDKDNGSKAQLDPKTLPEGLEPIYPNTNEGTTVGDSGIASVTFKLASGYESINYVLPEESDVDSYKGEFVWQKPWNIVKSEIQSTSWKNDITTDTNGHAFSTPKLRDPKAEGGVVEYEYYETDSMGNILNTTPLKESDIVWSESQSKFYIAKPVLQDTTNYVLDDPDARSKVFRVGKDLLKVQVSLEKYTMEYNSNPRHAKVVVANGALTTSAFTLTYYDGYTKLSTAPSEVGQYRVEVSLKSSYIDKYQIEGDYEFDYEIVKAKIPVEWNDNAKPPVLKLSYGQINGVEYEIVDEDDYPVDYKDLEAGVPYRIRAKIKNSQIRNFEFADGTTETDWHEFSVTDNDIPNLKDPNSPSNPSYPQTDPDLPTKDPDDNPPSGEGSGNVTPSGDNNDGNGGGTLNLGNVEEIIKQWWQVVASVISIVLIIAFLSKTAGYESKRKKFNKKTEKLESSVYATVATTGLFGLPMTSWTAIACVLMSMAVASFVIMMIARSRGNKAEEAYGDALEECNRNQKDFDERKREDEAIKREEEARKRDESMQMMFMSMMGGNGNMGQGMPQGAYMGGGYGLGAEDIRGIISDTVTALLPGVQQLLPQQASSNDEIVQRLIDENAKSQETIQELMQKLAEQPAEKVVVEKEVAAMAASDERFEQMMKTQESMMRNQEALIQKILDISATQPQQQPQVVEKVIEKEVPVEKIVEKVVEVPVPVEKVVEKVIEKEVKVAAPAKPKKEIAPRLTLDEAYALLSKQQKKYFDGLKEYALSKPNSKEKKSTYAITIGQSTVNPLLKLTIKKDMTVALFKMEDEYLKDIKRDASGDGTKIKVKETEVIISDAQACKAAKNMIDLREDQIERYNDLLKEQRAMKRK